MYGTLICLQMTLIALLPTVLKMQHDLLQKVFYSTIVCLIFCCEGGHFVLAPTIYAKLFGPEGGVRVYSVGFSFSGIAPFVNLLLINYFLDEGGIVALGYEGFCYMFACTNLIALILLLFIFKEERVILYDI